MDPSASPDETFFQLPDLLNRCPFKPVYHTNGDTIAAASDTWFKDGCRVFTEDLHRFLFQLKGGQLAAYCYNECEEHRFRVTCDFMNILFNLDDLLEDLKTKDTEIFADVVMNAFTFPQFYRPTRTAGKEQPVEEPNVSWLTRDYWSRCIADAKPGFQTRFVTSYDLYLQAVKQEVQDRTSGNIPPLATYIKIRHLTSGLNPSFDLIEYCFDMDLPDHVLENPIVSTMRDYANNFVAWSNDIYSYNVEQSHGITYNLVTVLMKHHDLDLQGAVDYAGNMCIGVLENYCECKARLPSFGLEIDKQVAAYMRGLEGWMSGFLEWAFFSLRYFGDKGQEIKEHRWVKLLPPKKVLAAAA